MRIKQEIQDYNTLTFSRMTGKGRSVCRKKSGLSFIESRLGAGGRVLQANGGRSSGKIRGPLIEGRQTGPSIQTGGQPFRGGTA